jgi:DNA replication protein DnaC
MRLRTVDQETVEYFRGKAGLALERMARIRREDCPRCDGVASDIGKGCTSVGDPDTEEHGFFDGPMCKWAMSEKTKEAEENLTKARAERMRHAGIEDKALVTWMAPMRAPPFPQPVWFGLDGQELRQAASESMAGAQAWLEYPDCKVLLILGGIGAGKTTAAAWVVAGERANAVWLPARTVDDLESWKLVGHNAKTAQLLVIDDLGTERDTESGFGRDTLGNLLTDRIDRGQRTVVTTNLSGAEIVKRYGERLRSRLQLRPLVGVIDAGKTDLRKLKRGYEQRMGEARDFRGGR